MGSCLSKKSTSVSVSSPQPRKQIESNTQLEKKNAEEGETMKKEVFVMKHRKSHEVERRSVEEKFEAQKPIDVVETGNIQINAELGNGKCVVTMATPVRTSSCTKEEVDAILIQCGRLSRSSSAGKVGPSVSGSENAGSHQKVRKYSGSKRSFDFDYENGTEGDGSNVDKDGVVMKEKEQRHRQTQRQSRTGGSQGQRRTPSRERDQHRPGSKERGGGGGGRRVSRSPGRRSESPTNNNNNNNNTSSTGPNSSAANSNNVSCRPGKMVSVPATVSSLAMDKSNNAGPGGSGGGGSEPNSTTNVKRIQVKRSGGGDSTVGSRSAASPRARSPARANQNQPTSLSRSNSRKAEQSPYRRNPLSEIDTNIVVEPTNTGLKSVNNIASQVPREKANADESKGNKTHTRSRSFRQSQDLDNKAESETPSYTALLLEDIQNFHQKNPAFTLPPSITKACSILEAVADLNSSNASNLFGTSLEDKALNPTVQSDDKMKRDPILESEVVSNDDLMQPSFHKYVTLRRGTDDDLEEQESSGSNSFVGSQEQWLSSLWEPNSADSTDRSTSSMARSRQSPLMVNKRHAGHQHSGFGRDRIGS